MELLLKFGISIFSFYFILLVSHQVSKYKKFVFLNRRASRYQTLDGLRGFLATSVFYTHYTITWYWINHGDWGRPPEDYYQNYGKVGVAVFFMITGFLFTGKLIKESGKIDWFKLYESRFFRIVPLYLLTVLMISLVVLFETNFKLNIEGTGLFKEYFRWFAFHGSSLNNFTDTKIINAGVDWTLKYEWVFYLLLPVLSIILFKFNSITKITILLVIILLYFWPIQVLSINLRYAILFMIGSATSIFCKNFNIPNNIIKSKYISMLSLIMICIGIFYHKTLSFEHIVAISIFFFLIASGNDMFGLFSTKASYLLGEISYSIYLLHGIVLYVVFSLFNIFNLSEVSLNHYLLFMPVFGALIVGICSLTYLLIEKPCITFGRRYFVTATLVKIQKSTNKLYHKDSPKARL